jgi:hypothetical protein
VLTRRYSVLPPSVLLGSAPPPTRPPPPPLRSQSGKPFSLALLHMLNARASDAKLLRLSSNRLLWTNRWLASIMSTSMDTSREFPRRARALTTPQRL